VVGIGADDAADIWYLALSNYMTSSTNFAAARTATISAATALFGAGSQQVTSVGDAWTAVGVVAAGTGGGGGGGTSPCTTTTYSGRIRKAGQSIYAPSSSGTAANGGNHTLALTGPSGANFDVYLQQLSGSTWSTVASGTGSTSTENVSYAGGTSGTYRVAVTSRSGSGTLNLSWCKP
jgi:streptogrisin C